MGPNELRRRVDDVLAQADDDEAAHSMGDALHLSVIAAFCPEWVQSEIERLSQAGFARWCA